MAAVKLPKTLTLHIGQAGFETFLAKEVGSALEKGPGWVLAGQDKSEPCFAHLSLLETVEVKAATVNALAGGVADYFRRTSIDERYDQPWPLCFEAADIEGLGTRCRGVQDAFREKVSRMARVMKLAKEGRPDPSTCRGLFVYLADFDRAFASRFARVGGQRRMADDPQAPSRSFLKVEEAYFVLGEAPASGQTVADLGAAPGGWSYSAARHGARVLAVDNGPLKGGAAGNPNIEARAEDAFRFRPRPAVDWLFCDLLDDPRKVIELLRRWVEGRWCSRFIVNLKFGRHDPLLLLQEAFSERTGIARRCDLLRARHLYHDREELTLVGRLRGVRAAAP
ncbi:MAG: rRNA methyltransferase [Elusimicrobia bacterium]|nr:rRNA methyltransferase [Elusimicrobiota bacterium]